MLCLTEIDLLTDEISMINLTMLHIINQQYNKIHQQNLTAILDSIFIVMLMNDFHQFVLNSNMITVTNRLVNDLTRSIQNQSELRLELN